MKKILIIIVISFMFSHLAKAQDPLFSQFYANPLYLNPGYAGTTEMYRFITNYRVQWPALPQSFNTYTFSFDYNMEKLNSGFGLLLYTDKMGAASLRTSTPSIIYSYKVHLPKDWVISPAVQFGYSFRDINVQKLLFGDQIDPDFGDVPISIDPAIVKLGPTQFFDFSSGLLVYNEMFWGGVAFHHMNQPNQSLIDGDSELPMKTTVHAGVRIPLYHGPRQKERSASIAPSFVYRKQGKFDQLDVGLHFNYDPIMVGAWYRGMPLQQSVSDNINQDAVSFMFGLRFDEFDMGYSYDITISQLGPAAGGAHEVSFIYRLDVQKRRKITRRQMFMPCPTF